MALRIGGIFNLKIDGTLYCAKGDFTYNLGQPKHEALIASSGEVAGFKVIPVVPFVEGDITDRGDLDIKKLLTAKNAVITLELVNGKVFVLSGAYSASDGNITTSESSLSIRFEGEDAQEFTS